MSTWREITQVDSNTVWQLLASAQQSTGGLNPPSFLKPPISPVLAEEDQDDGTAFIFSKIYLSHRGQLVLQHSVLFYIFMFSWDLKATPLCSAGPWTWSTDGPGCVAVGGEGAGSQCHFPFTFEGVVYQGCAYKPEFVTNESSKSQLTENYLQGVERASASRQPWLVLDKKRHQWNSCEWTFRKPMGDHLFMSSKNLFTKLGVWEPMDDFFMKSQHHHLSKSEWNGRPSSLIIPIPRNMSASAITPVQAPEQPLLVAPQQDSMNVQ